MNEAEKKNPAQEEEKAQDRTPPENRESDERDRKLSEAEEARRLAEEERDRALEAAKKAEEERGRAEEKLGKAEEERDGALRREEKRLRDAALRRILAEKGLSGELLDLAALALREEAAGFAYRKEGDPGADPEAGGSSLALADESRAALDGLLTGGPLRLLFRLKDAPAPASEAEKGADLPRAEGVAVANPPLGMGIGAPSREEILSIRDGVERRRAIALNPEVFGL